MGTHDFGFVCLVIALVLAALASFGGYWPGPAISQPNAYYWRGGLLPTSFFFYLLFEFFRH